MSVAVMQLELTDSEFALLSRFIYDKTGIALTEQKKSLLSNRLRKRLKALGLDSFKEYYDLLTKGDTDGEEFSHFLNAVTTNETYFFRNDKLWEFVGGDLIKWLVDAKGRSVAKSLKFWSAASSTGAEAYTLAITLAEKLPDFPAWKITILGSDISEKVLAQARQARYNDYAVQKIDPVRRRKYFIHDKSDDTYQLRDEMRSRVQFRFHNLRDAMSINSFDVIFLRNVMMYFDLDMKKRALDTVTNALAPGGYLIVGDVDPMREGSDLRDYCSLDYVRPAVYRKVKKQNPRNA